MEQSFSYTGLPQSAGQLKNATEWKGATDRIILPPHLGLVR